MKKIKIGILISNNENKVIGYSLEKGFFICKGLFFEPDFYENNHLENTIWFSNISKKQINNKYIKANDYFDIKLTEMLVYYGISNVKIGNTPNFKIILKKLYDIISVFVENHISAFKKNDIEKVNPKAVLVREEKRKKDLYNSDSYVDLLTLTKNEFNKELITNIIEYKNKKYSVSPFYFYNDEIYKDTSKNKIKAILENESLNKNDKTVLNRKSKESVIKTLNINSILDLGEKSFLPLKNYKVSGLGSSYDVDKKNKDILKIDEVLFYLVKIKKTPKIRIFKNLIDVNLWVSKKELEFYLNNDFSLSIEYICEEERGNFKPLFNYSGVSIQDAINEDMKTSSFHQFVHLSNYLQIIKSNDNNILNKWIISNIKTNTLNLIIALEKSEIEIVEYDYDFIKISYNEKDKDRIRNILEHNKINYPSDLL